MIIQYEFRAIAFKRKEFFDEMQNGCEKIQPPMYGDS